VSYVSKFRNVKQGIPGSGMTKKHHAFPLHDSLRALNGKPSLVPLPDFDSGSSGPTERAAAIESSGRGRGLIPGCQVNRGEETWAIVERTDSIALQMMDGLGTDLTVRWQQLSRIMAECAMSPLL
jgi:hypothetical protein